jgi:hypothetical protein
VVGMPRRAGGVGVVVDGAVLGSLVGRHVSCWIWPCGWTCESKRSRAIQGALAAGGPPRREPTRRAGRVRDRAAPGGHGFGSGALPGSEAGREPAGRMRGRSPSRRPRRAPPPSRPWLRVASSGRDCPRRRVCARRSFEGRIIAEGRPRRQFGARIVGGERPSASVQYA